MDQKAKYPFFPLFLNLDNQKCVIVGGGRVGSRRAEVLLRYGAKVVVIDPAPRELPDGTKLFQRSYLFGDLKGATLAIAASNDRVINRAVRDEAEKWGIPISVADCREECTFLFPAVCLEGNLSIGVVSSGDPTKTALAAEKIRETIGEI